MKPYIFIDYWGIIHRLLLLKTLDIRYTCMFYNPNLRFSIFLKFLHHYIASLIQKSAEALKDEFLHWSICYLFKVLLSLHTYMWVSCLFKFPCVSKSSLIKTCMPEDFIAHGYNCYVCNYQKGKSLRL